MPRQYQSHVLEQLNVRPLKEYGHRLITDVHSMQLVPGDITGSFIYHSLSTLCTEESMTAGRKPPEAVSCINSITHKTFDGTAEGGQNKASYQNKGVSLHWTALLTLTHQ